MDHGAHYVKTDLQVHTPRDPNWKLSCTTHAARAQFGRDMVATCRATGLGAVAITDHHDFAFVRWIRTAARSEVGEDGQPLPADRQLVVFPGTELTLDVPCQALLILSANFPDDRLSAVLDKLGIDPAPDSDEKAKPPSRLPFHSLQEVHDRLDETDWLVGQYILLPHVTDHGHGTLIRQHMQAKYIDMPCVGGYVEKLETGTGPERILAGRDANWGNKRIARILTSDARTLAALGIKATWIKWAEPSAEALRQACLAEESRIAHLAPPVPGVRITRLHISNSRFLGPVDLELNPQYNALIGGRGTGKSSCLEYLRWGLCDEPPKADADDDGAGLQLRRQRLIEQTLTPVAGHVEVHFEINGVAHVVRRHAKTGDLLLKVGAAELGPATEEQVRGLLPIEAYSQRQLSGVGVRQDELIRFVTAPIRGRLAELEVRDDELVRNIRENFVQVERQRSLSQTIARDTLAIESLTQQIETLHDGLEGLSDEDRAVLAAKSSHDEADLLVTALSQRVNRARKELEQCDQALRQLVPSSELPDSDDLAERSILEHVQREAHQLLDATQRAVQAATAHLDDGSRPDSPFARRVDTWADRYRVFTQRYSAAAARSTTHASTLDELKAIEQRRRTLQATLESQTQQLRRLGDPEAQHRQLRAEWCELQRDRTAAIKQQCEDLTELSDGMIRASVGGVVVAVRQLEALKAALQGSGVRGNKQEQLLDEISSHDDPLVAWHTTLDELETRVLAEGNPGAPLPTSTVALGILGANDIHRAAPKLTPNTILNLSLIAPDDHPVFEYRAKEGEYIAFKDASAGQQATALLRVLLKQGGPPLVIDQPEDDLDSQVIQDVVRRVWEAKGRRQLIFSSHNANLVVNGDAELVVCCDYRAAGDHSAGKIKLEGAIDIPDVRLEITIVMEGGERAFRLRKDKYGF